MKNFKIYTILFLAGGMVYSLIELAFDGSTHFSMFICGGLALILIGLLNEKRKMNIFAQMVIGSLIITCLELIFGLIFNQKFQIWDYRNLPYNFKGQICLLFSIFWVGLSFIAVKLDDFLRKIC